MGTVEQSRRRRKGCSKDLERRARAIIETHSFFVGGARLFEFQYRESEGVLVVRGIVPTFYLKQVLQSLLKNLDGIRRIDNQVTVDWSDG